MIQRSNTPPRRNQRLSTTRQRRHQHLLDVKVRSRKATMQRNRRLLSWFCGLVLVVSSIGAVAYGAREALRRFLWENPEYRVAELRVDTDGGLTRERIIEATGIAPGVNIFAVNIARARHALLAVPQVEAVEITRTLPNKIAITVAERKPVAWAAPAGVDDPSATSRSFLIDRRGILLPSQLRSEYLHLPIIYGLPIETAQAGDTLESPESKAALDLIRLNTEHATQFQVRSIDVSKGYCMVVTERNRAQITFGFDRIDWQLNRLATVLSHVERTRQELRTVNLMVQRNVPVTFAPIEPAVLPEEDEEQTAIAIPNAAPAPAVRKVDAVSKPATRVAKPSFTPKVRRAEPVKPKVAAKPKAKPVVSPKPVRKALPASAKKKNTELSTARHG